MILLVAPGQRKAKNCQDNSYRYYIQHHSDLCDLRPTLCYVFCYLGSELRLRGCLEFHHFLPCFGCQARF